MNRKWIVGAALVAALGLPVAARAHTGHAHKVMGTIVAVHDTHLEVKTKDGKIVAITLDDKTAFRQGKAKADVKILKVGGRVVVEATEDEATRTMMAKTVQMAAATTTAAAKPAAPHGH